ncbi:TlpA family protein disulfide reductase [Mucilaginibacter phyllosphaerae]|uniref:Thiol-disulfide isomerase/thioredoxin n=1 Tax=Mucilaginibacter phyllosphaerae TaxID=1812349 RepID=A0A4Y8A933_9SPHI|nr:TlpA disulfide reductase family protein [Mucilaginibacter phyllosphaerae]MBB3969573.1 thiol-disulfide isomerase/thioredoxin [Mucilaginibacter phyllosphaerae]TEW64964.1 TlpA family protein disulfide reductase [Mucilaginibacter phyllosphaerae]GGH18825.1 hypothetical protein GCM10007352_29810 [Mucilaginibacter phyllosphaerae]
MKKTLSLLIIIAAFALSAQSQQTPVTGNTVERPESFLNNKIIIDSAGAVLPRDSWRALLNSGGYTLKSTSESRDTMRLVRMTAADIELRESMMRLPKQSESFPVGAKMEMFKARDITGKKIDPKELQGKTIVLNFWFIACPPCKAEIPELNKIVADYATNPNVVFIAVCLDQRWEIKDFLKQTPFNYMQVADGRSYSNDFNVKGYPTSVVVDPQGIIRFSSTGYGGSVKHLKKAIEESSKI